MLQVSLLGEREDLVARCVPYVLVEDLDLYGAGVPCGVDGLPDAPDLDRPVSHHGAAQEEVGLRGEPVVRVEAEDAPRSARDLWIEVGILPDVVCIDDDAHPFGFETLGDVQRLG
jgi:hypothetical protein